MKIFILAFFHISTNIQNFMWYHDLAFVNQQWDIFFKNNNIDNHSEKLLIRANPSRYQFVPPGLVEITQNIEKYKLEFLNLMQKFASSVIRSYLYDFKIKDDYISEGIVAAIKSFYLYNDAKVSINTYAYTAIYRAIIRYISFKSQIIRKTKVISANLECYSSKQESFENTIDFSFLTEKEQIVIYCKIAGEPYPSHLGSESTIMRLLRSARVKIAEKFSLKNARWVAN